MTMINPVRSDVHRFGFSLGATGNAKLGLAKIKASVDALRNRRQVKRLYHLDDHMLDDMGIRREDIKTALNVPFAQNPSQRLAELRACRIAAARWAGRF